MGTLMIYIILIISVLICLNNSKAKSLFRITVLFIDWPFTDTKINTIKMVVKMDLKLILNKLIIKIRNQ